ncbi:TPA: hypothetical protein N0F65_012755 [Lagenidium giganteum]|uniref:Leucine-rich repeat domain, L domain-like n=1 Tax=Lagenidium giganteum TaxID=4803 RepID=A0AAV2YAA4_9STRA|nr:TPA: hypothetical protein N0F65_012755 [Lagenidium giganteum]
MLREAIEVAAQVDQAYNASVLVSHSYINHLLVVVLVINSWSTPVIHRVMHVSGVQTTNDVVRARVACLLVDAFLNAVSSMAVPIVLLVPFWRDFIWEIHDFPLQLMYNDVFYARVATESQMIAASSFWALCMKLVPLISVYLCLSTVSNLAELRTVKLSDRRLGIAAVTHQSNPLSSSASAGRIYMNPQRQITTQSGGRFGHYINIIVQFGFAITGIVVVAIHVAAHASALRLAQDAQCDLVVAPWFTTKYPCMVYTYDCDALNDTAAGGDYLSFLDDRALLTLNFAHCSELVVPTDIQRFSNLLGMNFKHVVLAEWPMDAVLTPHLFPSMLFLVFSHVNWSGIPEVLLGPLPEKLGDIEMSHTNISIIPDDLDQYWFNVGTLVIEFCEIKQIPETLMRMNLYDISLVGNKLENVSVLTRLPDSIVHVMLDHNPFRELPASFENADIAIAVLSAGHTLVEEVPVILAANVDQIFLMDTPHCASASGWQPSVPVICDRSYYRSDGMCQLT